MADYTSVIDMKKAPAEQKAKALDRRGATLGSQGHHSEALSDFQAALAVPGIPEATRHRCLLNRGVAFECIGQPVEAEQDFVHAAVNPGTALAGLLGLVRVMTSQGRAEEAARWVARVGEFEAPGSSLDDRLSSRMELVTQFARRTSPEEALGLLDRLRASATPELAERLSFMGPGLNLASTGDDKSLFPLSEEEKEIARRIAAAVRGNKET